jgi:hypothetical protein
MKNYVSYVIQGKNKHSYHSEIINIKAPQYSYSSDTQVSEVLKWLNKTKLEPDEKLVLLNIFKI